MSGDLPEPKIGDTAPEPDDGRYHVREIDNETGQMRIEWSALGRVYTCWVPQDAFERVTAQ